MFKGDSHRVDREDISDGMDGASSIGTIKNGFCLEAVNVDIGLSGKVEKRAGYQVFAQRLPIRVKRLEDRGAYNRFVFDVIPEESIDVSLYSNTSANLTATSDALYFRINDATNTIFATFSSTVQITTDTILSCLGDDGYEHFVQPLVVYADIGTVQVLLPMYVKNWWTGVTLTDTAATVKRMRLAEGYSILRLSGPTIGGLAITDASPFTCRIDFASEPAIALQVGATVLFETCLLDTNGNGLTGTVSSVTSEYCDVLLDGSSQPEGTVPHSYLSVRFINGKHLNYRGPLSLDITPPIIIADPCSIYAWNAVEDAGNFLGFLYGTGIDAGPVNIMGKYFDSDTSSDRIMAGIDGYIFAERDSTESTINTIAGLVYTGAVSTISVTTATNTFSIPLAGANDVYQANDVVTISYADGTDSDWRKSENIITETYTVSSATASALILNAGEQQFFLARTNTRFRFERTSDTVMIQTPAMSLCNGMTVQYQLRNKILPTHEIIDCNYYGSTKYIKLDSIVTWSSDDSFILGPLFVPILSDVSCTYATEPQARTEVNIVAMERSAILATGLSGIWRFNGRDLLNMRIPRPGSGYIRNIPGTGGGLKLDKQEDGTYTGRRYDFLVTYQYVDMTSGRLITYQSGRSPVSVYSILSEPDDLGSSFSKLVELQVPSIPHGMGLPASDMYINVYRTKSGTLSTEQSAEFYLLERQVKNNPDMPFTTIIAGTESQFIFDEGNYKIYYASVTGDGTTPELRREIIDPPLSSVVSTLENRIIAAGGYDHPQIHFICKDVYATTDNSFNALFTMAYTPRQEDEIAYKFFSAPCVTTTTSGSGGVEGIPFQVTTLPSYEIKKITYADTSHTFKVALATVTPGTQYLVRLANGKKEAQKSGTADPYYNGFDFAGQVFTATATAQQLEAQKKWTRQDASYTVLPPTEPFILFNKIGEISEISTTNGLVIIGNSAGTVNGIPEFILYTTLTVVIGDYLILKGLGTTGQLKNAKGEQLSFDRDLVMYVNAGTGPYTLTPLIMGNTVGSHFASAGITSAISVSNALTGVICESFSVFKLQSATAYATSDWSKTPLTAQVQLTTSPTITPVAGDTVCLDGLPSEVPAGSGFNYNGNHEIVSFAGDTFVIKVSPPDSAKGTLTQDFTSETTKGKLIWTKESVTAPGNGTLQIATTPTVLSVAIAEGDFIYMVFKGESPDSSCLALTGCFEVLGVIEDGDTVVSALAIGDTLVGIEIRYSGTLDYTSLTAASATRIILAGRTSATSINVPVPILATKDGSQDITGTLYAAIDGYTPLERVIRPLVHCLNSVLWEEGFAYWGAKQTGNVESEHPGNVMPTNGLKFMPHLYPNNTFKYRDILGNVQRVNSEPQWKCRFAANKWSVEGNEVVDVISDAEFTITTATMHRPSRLWFTNPTGTYDGQAFREQSFDDVESQDGEKLVGMATYKQYSIIAKQNSLWNFSFGNSYLPSRSRIPGTIGASSHKNMISTDRGVFLMHDTGLYITDGNTCDSIHQTRRTFAQKVVQNRTLFPLACGFHNTLLKKVYLGIPLSEGDTSLATNVDSQFAFDYSLGGITSDTVGKGWTVNTNLEATNWIGVYNDVFFSGVHGAVNRIRTERGPSFWRDGVQAIPMRIKTRYILADDAIQGRFIRSLVFQFGKETGVNMRVGMAWDFFQDYQDMQEYTIPIDGFGTLPFGTGYWGADKFIENQRRTPDRMRVYQFSLKFEDDTIDSSGSIYGIFVQSEQMSLKLIGQGGART